MRTERVSLAKSKFFRTSIKKLYPLARQIAGKPIEEAIVQMRFSKKKAAVDVKKHLEYARNVAIVRRGMGLGGVKAVAEEGETEEEAKEENTMPKGMVVVDKAGKRRWVTDKTNMYVDQAWVGRGSFAKSTSFRAKGRIDVLRHPTTSKQCQMGFLVVLGISADVTTRYFCSAEGRSNEDKASGRERTKEAE